VPVFREMLAVGLLVAGAAAAISARAQSDDLAALNRRISELHNAGKYAEAIPLAATSLELTRSQKGHDHLDTATRMTWLGGLYQSQGRYAEAEPLLKQAVSILEKALALDHPDVGVSLHHLAELYRNQGRYTEAEPIYQRSLSIFEGAGPRPPRRRHCAQQLRRSLS
jgi:tetratricopeptide (TPR) repeat protein